ncbi:PLAT/LH2 domain-containing protein [Candidatus Caldatribacterium sp. SIUC1]|uniref:PLAT/LH2 domain-containing protein n=1 Tax=Candidatus Caldatribacterium sp. SIUC1 TaxID=3418365 RepID=UPI003F68F0A2
MPFEILYRWEPLRETSATRVVAEVSLYPTSGPLWEGNLLAFSVRQQVLVVVDLATGKVVFEEEYPDKCIVHAVRNGRVFFCVGGASRVFVVSPSNAQERSFPGRLVLVTEGGFLVTNDRGTIKVFHPATGECLFAQRAHSAHPVFAIGNRIFVPTQDKSHNFAGYVAFSAPDRKVSPCPSLGRGSYTFYRPGEGTFPQYAFPDAPLPVLHREERDTGGFLELLDTQAQTLWKIPLALLGIVAPGAVPNPPLVVFDRLGEKMLLAIAKESDPGEKTPFVVCVVDYRGNHTLLGEFRPHSANKIFGAFLADTSVAVLVEETPDTITLQIFSSQGELLRKTTLEPNLPSPFWPHFVEGRELLLFRKELFLRYQLPEGEITGVYAFPEGFEPDLSRSSSVITHAGKVFTFLSNRFGKEGGIEKPSLVSFDVTGESWPLPLELVSVSPHGEHLYQVFEDLPTELRFRTPPGLEAALRVTAGEGPVQKREKATYEWHTPTLPEKSPKNVALFASLGPAQRTFPMEVVPFPNPLTLEVTEWYEGEYLVVLWTLRNSSFADISDLSFALTEMHNLAFSHGDPFPERIAPGERLSGKLSFTVRITAENPDVSPRFRGYELPTRGILRVSSSRGVAEAPFGKLLPIPPRYAFRLGIYDPAGGKWLPASMVAQYLRIEDQEGRDITPELTMRAEGERLLVGNIAPGVPGKPLKLRLIWETPPRSFRVEVGSILREGKVEPRFENVLAPKLRTEGVIEISFPANTPKDQEGFRYNPPYYELRLPENQPPQADFTLVDDEMSHFRSTVFDATSSSDTDGVITEYWWWSKTSRFPDTHARRFAHSFTASGIIPVTLEVQDDRKTTSRIEREVAVDATRDIGGRHVTIPPAFVRQARVSYEVEVLTGDTEGAGTDARVFLALYEKQERQGVVYGSGVMELTSPFNPFERGGKDRFFLEGRKIENLDHIALLHDNSGSRPGWYVVGLAVKDTATKREWVFLIDRWLALDEADHKTYGEFKPLTSTYPAGVVVEGDRNSYNLTELSETVFIVPSGIAEFYFTCGDGTKAMAVYRENGTLLGWHNASGKKRVVPYIPENEWGVKFETANLTRPQRFKVEVFSGNSQTEQWIWVFPPNWSSYPQAALRASLLFGFKNEVSKAEESNIFYSAKRIREYLAGLRADVVNASLPSLQYGMSALSIFGPSPDSLIQDTLSTVVEQYLENQEGLIASIFGFLTSEPVSEAMELLTTLYDAYRWATEFPAVLGTSVSEVYKVILLKHLGENDRTLRQIDLLLRKARELVAETIRSLEANDAFACNEALTKLRTLVVGNNPSSNTLSDHQISYGDFGIEDLEPGLPDYPLAILVSEEIVAIHNWRKEGHPVYAGDELLSILPYDKVTCTNAALDIFEPLFREVAELAGILVNLCLLEPL